MTIAILGSKGQIGSALLRRLATIFSCEEITRIKLDCSNIQKVENFFSKNKFSTIINAVAFTNVDLAETHQKEAVKLNIKLPHTLANIARSNDIPLIHFSTDYVFDGLSNKPYKETDKPNPLNIYGSTKLKGDENIIKTNCQGIIFRVGWVFSANQNNFLNTIIKLSQIKNEIEVVNDQMGSPTSAELIASISAQLILKKLHNHPIKVINISPAGIISWYELANYLFKHYKQKTPIKLKPITTSKLKKLAKRPKFSKLDSSLLEKTLGITMPTWQEGVNAFIKSKQCEKI